MREDAEIPLHEHRVTRHAHIKLEIASGLAGGILDLEAKKRRLFRDNRTRLTFPEDAATVRDR